MRHSLICVLLTCICSLLAFAGHKAHAPLPSKLLAAKTVWIENHAEAGIADAAYRHLTKWGRLQVVDGPDKADLTISLSMTPGESIHGTTSTYHPPTDGNDTGHTTYGTVDAGSRCWINMQITETGTGQLLYSDNHICGLFRGATDMLFKDLRKRIEEQERQKN